MTFPRFVMIQTGPLIRWSLVISIKENYDINLLSGFGYSGTLFVVGSVSIYHPPDHFLVRYTAITQS